MTKEWRFFTRWNKRIQITVVLLFAAMIALFFLNLATGSAALSFREVTDALLGRGGSEKTRTILWELHMPRTGAAILLGGALAVSGVLLQTFFRNSIAGPFILGISSGARLTVACALILCLGRGILIGSAGLVAAAFAGAMASLLVVLLIARRAEGMAVLMVCGVMIGYVCSALTELLVAFAGEENIVHLHNWSMGSFSGIDGGDLAVIAAVLAVTAPGILLLAKPMAAFQMGEDFARSVGVNLWWFRVGLILLSGLLAAVVAAYAGPVSFVGIAVPHLIRIACGTEKPVVIVPVSFLGGGVFCLFCDFVARNVFAPTELSISTITAVFGAPIVISMLLAERGRRG